MRRFCQQKKQNPLVRVLLSAVLFCALMLLFAFGIDQISNRTSLEEQRTLEAAIQRGIIQCYAEEGRYPESLDYLKQEYRIQYDNNKFFVDYQISGANIMPDVTVIQRNPAS